MLTSRRELVEWLKGLGIEINKIEEIGQGTAICKLLSILHPHTNIKYILNPSSPYEYLKNLKTAQTFFQENKIEVRFPIEKLVLCKLQDNLEFAQWMYKYYIKIVKIGDSRSTTRQEIIDNIKKHNGDQITKLEDKYNLQCEENKKLITIIRNQEIEIESLKSKVCHTEVKNIIKELERNRDFYFSILIDVEKYITECKDINENIKEDLLNLLYRKI